MRQSAHRQDYQNLLIQKGIRRYGYYLFLGSGDFFRTDNAEAIELLQACRDHGFAACSCPKTKTDYVYNWDLPAWQQHIDAFKKLGVNTLEVLFNGHYLAYPSKKYPTMVEKGHPNVKAEFFSKALAYAQEQDIKVGAVFCTTGHTLAFVMANPETAIRNRNGEPMPHSRIACFHHEKARQYALDIIHEVLTRYQGFDNVILHPPEFTRPCFCEKCQQSYRKKYGKEMLLATDEEAWWFSLEAYLAFQKTVLEPEVARLAPDAQRVVFAIPRIFVPPGGFEQCAPLIDTKTVINEWDYNFSEEAFANLPSRLARYRQFGHELWFTTTVDYKVLSGKEHLIPEQIDICRRAGVGNFFYFMGPFWSSRIEKSSWYLHQLKNKL